MAANCVTNLQKKLADYIAALDKFNIPDSNLEMLLHKWLNLPENAELFRLGKLPFPSYEWLQEHLYAPASIVSEPKILEMYDKHLSEPIITDTVENANNIVRAVSKIISKDSVKILPTKDGKYLVVVTRPKFDNSAEINKILENAPRDEQGRLLAPNGKPSNLTEQQYAQVRTKAFIDWFGDWETPKQVDKKIITGLKVSSDQNWLDGSIVVKRDNSYFYVNDNGINIEITKNEYEDFNEGKTIILNKKVEVIKELDTNFSKVLDENGEPLVMYHRSNVDIKVFDINKSHHGGFWFSRNPNYYKNTKAKLPYAIPVFLNIRTPNEINHETFLAAVDGDVTIEGGLINTKFDGWITQNKYIPEFYGDYYNTSIVFAMAIESNQIKSATDNIGTFSKDNNIYASRKDATHRQGVQSIEDIFGKGLFELDTTITIQDAIKALEKNKEIAPIVALLKHLQGAHPEIIIYRQDRVFDSRGREVDGLYDASNKKIIVSNNSTKPVGQVLTHELLHPLLLDKLNANPEIRSELDRIRENAISVLGEESLKYYGLTSVEELISEVLTESKLIKALDNIEGIKNTKAKGILQQIRDWFNKCLHLIFKKEPSLLDNTLYEIELLISSNSEYTLQSFDIIERNIYSMKEYDASLLERRLLEIQKNYPWLFKTDDVNHFIRRNNGKHEVYPSYKGKYLLNNRITANKKLRDLHKGEFSSAKDNYNNEKSSVNWARTAENNYEVSSQGDKRFSALYATFKEGTIIDGEDVGGKTIEWVYQNIIKKSGKGKVPSKDSKLFIPSREGYKGNIIPSEDTIFVFGSNPEGRHGAGAAKVAKDKFGAQYGVGEGLTGNAYALPTKDLRVKENKGLRSISKESIIESIKTLYKVATENPGKQFKVAFRNKLDETTLNGYTGEEMIDMFLSAGPIPSNIIFSEEWLNTGKFNLSKQEIEDFSYEKGYLPLWQEWAKQNPELIEELRKATVGKTLTDKFASTRVSQARALADILNSYQLLEKLTQEASKNVTSFELPLSVAEKTKVVDSLATEDREKTENEVFFEQQSELARLLNTIYGIDAVFTGAEYGQIVHDIIYKISDIITEVERNPEAALRYNSNIQDTSVLKNADRKNIFALLGFDNILNFISSEYFHPANNTAIDGRKAIKQAKIIRDNIKAFVKSGMSLFAQLELFSLPSIDNLELVDTESNTTDPNVNEVDNSAEFLQEMVGDSQEAWQRESRTEVAYDRASILVKQALTQCYKLNPDGTPITDKWGVKQRMDGREALQAIIKWTQGALTLSSMVKKLEAHATKEKWLQPIIDRLKDSSGKETAFLSQFFGVVSKYFQLYSIGKNTGKVGKKNYTVFEVNTHPALTEAKRGISGQYNAGVHPLFDSNGNVNSTSFELLKTISETLHKMLYSEDNTQQISELLSDASMLLGYPVSVEGIQEILNADTFKQMTANSLLFIVKGIENNKNKDTWQPFSAKREDDGIINNIGKFIEPITSRLEDVANTSFYDSGNMYQSYVIPSYLTKLILKMSLSTEEEYTEFIEKEYGKFAQFKDSKSQWRNSWLQLLQDIPDARHLFTHKVQLNFDGNKYMVSRGGARSMSDADLTLSIIAEYFKEESANSTKRLAPAWFRVPLMSNKPSSEFIKFYSYRGPDYKNRVLNGCLHLFRQELSRMQTVKKRLEIFEKGSPELIQSFDGERGLKFCFFDFLNNVDNSRFKELVEKYTTNTITELEKGELSDLGKTLIQRGIEEEWQKQLTEWQNNGVVEAAGNIQNISKDNVEKALENFFWNDFLASNNILNLTITDLAYYKNTEDVQKRLAQLHAPGIRANIEATDFEGKKVSDGYTRTIYLKDLEIDGKTLKSNIIENVKVVFNRKLETLKGTPLYDAAKAAYNSIIESFEKGINVTDAQGYASISSYRKKALLFGKWNTQAEEIYQKIISDEYTYTDIQTIFQPLKPFVYTQIEKDSDVDGVELPTIKMGVQNKNSEYLLIMAAAITQNEDTGMPNYLRAIYKVMEESHKDSVKGIDTVQFESTVKTGLTGVIDITEATTTEEAEELLKDAIYSNRETREYDKTFVLELPFEDYCIQQEVPAHFRDHELLQGSQIRMITVSDLNPNETYEIEGRKLSAEEFRNEYEQTVAANILESINLLIEEFNLSPDATTKDRNIALAKVLQKEILSSPRYGIDLLMSCLLDENGKFMLPLGDPIQSKRIEQLINSIVKNRINKLKIAGGPIVQVSNFGTSRQLNIRFKGKNGETLKTLNDYISEGKTEQEWVKYIKENLAGIAYYEAFVPVYAAAVFEDFMDAQGNIDIEAVEAVNPDLLKMIGYRIPSEDKYSMAPIKVVGFMPKEAGDGIMLPYEITLITGSDRDVIVSTSII